MAGLILGGALIVGSGIESRLKSPPYAIMRISLSGVAVHGILSILCAPSALKPMALSRNEAFRIQALQLTDALLVWLSFWIAWETRDAVRDWLDMGVEAWDARDTINWVLYIAVPFTPLALEFFGFYRRIRTKRTGQSIVQIFEAMVVIALMIGMFAVFAQLTGTRRLVLGIGFLLVFCLMLARDRLTAIWLNRKSHLETARERVIIAGSGGEMAELLGELDPEITSGWLVIEHFDLEQRPVDELFALLKKQSVGRVIFAAKESGFEKVARAVEACELQGVEAWIAASFIRTQIARPVFDAVGDRPMLVLRSTPELSWELLLKGLIDRMGSALIILLTLPLWIFAAIGIRLKSPGAPVLFSQMRAGRYGQPFRMWKFRTMVANAEQMLDQIKKDHGNEMQGPVFKLDNDPRIFPFGNLLRKLSIDELPQLINVVKGEMSLVGPRPLPLYEVDAFCEISHRRRLSVKPGITCEWQAGGRNKINSFDEWVRMDLRYIDNWSIWLDLKILLRTIPAVLFGKGAK
jgi:exopolysaccharide biosynthesis polyprenyl glycosylphosphotransferase